MAFRWWIDGSGTSQDSFTHTSGTLWEGEGWEAGSAGNVGASTRGPSSSAVSGCKGVVRGSFAVTGRAFQQQEPAAAGPQASGLKTGITSSYLCGSQRSQDPPLRRKGSGRPPSFRWGVPQNLRPSLFTPAHFVCPCKHSVTHKLRETVDDEV